MLLVRRRGVPPSLSSEKICPLIARINANDFSDWIFRVHSCHSWDPSSSLVPSSVRSASSLVREEQECERPRLPSLVSLSVLRSSFFVSTCSRKSSEFAVKKYNFPENVDTRARFGVKASFPRSFNRANQTTITYRQSYDLKLTSHIHSVAMAAYFLFIVPCCNSCSSDSGHCFFARCRATR